MAEEKRPTVAFLGPEGSYTHQATLDAFPPSSTQVTLIPSTTIEDVFSAVQSGTATRGVVPFENSSNGSVVFTLDLFANLNNAYPDILVCGEAYVGVRHCLLGYESKSTCTTTSVQDGQEGRKTDLSHIKKLYSHPQAWGQCKNFLATHFKTAERHDVSSTSKAAEIASQDHTGESAALSSFLAADLFGLNVLARGINDVEGNSTRFFVLRNRWGGDGTTTTTTTTSSSTTTTPTNKQSPDNKLQTWKSLITFTIEHTNPGALANCLTVFSSHGINLTSINTRPSGVGNWHYVFFVEFQGRKTEVGEGEGGDGGDVDQALKELDKVCRGWRWLGSWENRLIE
ncbi:prephenate dehydratase [Alternaria panax]|uniref:prephenate dehydratase n=1 Tax=Alternaria panax TaxID=48097 RepID=A0AAD4IK87_9PLEO|nr:prephenate dehydratase [Alternaria panax]